jgi:hypothetical protein
MINTTLLEMIQSDGGLHAVYKRGLGVELDQKVTVGEHTAQILWAYADKLRLAVGFTSSGNLSVRNGIRLQTREGEEVPMINGSRGKPPVYFFHFDVAGLNSLKDLQLVLLPESAVVPLTLKFSLEQDQTVATLHAEEAVTDQNITLTLREVIVTPTQTRWTVCFVPPVTNRNWTVLPSLLEIQETNGSRLVSGKGEEDGEICDQFLYNKAIFDTGNQSHLEIRELVGSGTGGGNDQVRIKGNWRFDFTLS